jgi:formate-dependent nitrite reductase membrane component NrfD
LTAPANENDKLLRQKFFESISGQSDLMDKVSGNLLTLELAIPGLYAAVLKLVAGDTATVPRNAAFYGAFGCWFVALVLTLAALIPRSWNVDRNVIKQNPEKLAEGLGIEDFFRKSAEYKRTLILLSAFLFFTGVFCAAFTIG